MDPNMEPKLGQVVQILRGKDQESFAVVVGILDERFVQIADGDKRKFDLPKKKNVTHLEFKNFVSSEVASSLQETGRVTNGKLRFALLKFLECNSTEVNAKETRNG